MVLVQPPVSAWQLPGMILIPASDQLKLLPSTGKQYGVAVGQCLSVKVSEQAKEFTTLLHRLTNVKT